MDLRAVVLMNALLCIVDRAVGLRLKDLLETVFRPIPGCFAGGQKYTQTLDIGHSANL